MMQGGMAPDAGGKMDEQEIRDFLNENNVPQFVDMFVQKLIEFQPDDFKPLLRELIERVERSNGKGAKARAAAQEHVSQGSVKMKALKYGGDPFAELGLGEWNVPAYCRRDPRLRPSVYHVKRQGNGVTTAEVTSSEIKAAKLKKDYASTVAGQFNYAANKCVAACKKLVAECERDGKPFFDEHFWYGKRNSMYPKGCPSDCTVTEPLKAMRSSELYPGAPLFSGGIQANDIVQGAVGDCFYIGAVSALACSTAVSMKPLQRLFVYSNVKHGVYGVMFFKNGGWEWVIVDDWIAVSSDNRGNVWPQYASPGTEPELWPLIIEKAYAKVHFCWDSIDGGWTRQALEDLTGGLAYTLDLRRKDAQKYGGSDHSAFKAICDDPLTVLGCAVGNHVREAAGAGRAGEQGAVYGLFKGHAYSVLKCSVTSDGQAFVRVRNPWGNDAEWTGPYSDRSSEWNRNPIHKRELAPEMKADGAFWMPWDYFRKIFTDIDVARYFEYDTTCLSMFGTAPRYDMQANNTFILKVDQPLKNVVFSIGQDDPLTKTDHHIRKNGRFSTMNLSIYKLTQLPDEYSGLRDCLDRKVQTEKDRTRTLFHELDLEPGYYSLVPRVFDSSGIGYYVRVHAPAQSGVSIFRFSDGPSKALSVEQAKAAGEEIPAVAVPASAGGQIVTDVPAAESAAVQSTGKTTEEKIMAALGVTNQDQYNRLVSDAFESQDRYGSGRLDKKRTQSAIEQVITSNKKISETFDNQWSALQNGSSSRTYRVRLVEFKKLMEGLLLELLKR